ncbi:MAG: apolipoprotein N-acyltransferase [Acidimicrobiia bacterium]
MTRRAWRDPWVWRRIGASAIAGLLVALAFPPLDLGPLALVGLVPLLWAWRGASPGTAAWCGFVFGAAQMAIVCSWVFYFGAVAIVPFTILVALYPALAGLAVGLFERFGVRSAWISAAAFTVCEWARGHFPVGGLQWGELGVALHNVAPARALASYGGVPLLTFLVVLVNGFVLDANIALRDHNRRPAWLAVGGVVGVVALTALGVAFRTEPTTTGTVRYAMMQANNVNRYFTPEELATNPLQTKHLTLAEQLQGPYDLIVFPESSLENSPLQDDELRAALTDLALKHDSTVVANGITYAPDGKIYNTNVVYAPNGSLEATYSKMHLVPFGEYVPFNWLRDYIPELSMIRRNFTPGPGRATFDVGGRRAGSVICFESGFPRSVRPYVVDDGVELIVVTTNNRSYERSANSEQHVAMSQMRAAEFGRPVLHSAVSGITAAIDADGRVLQHTELFEVAITQGTIATTKGLTPYARFGDWALVASCCVLVGAMLGVAGHRFRRRRGESYTLGRDEPEISDRQGS